MRDIKGRYIWIVGASSGIGRALAIELARQGATLALSARRVEDLNALRDELGGAPHIVAAFDSADQGQLDEAFAKVTASFPRLDSVLYLAATYDADPVRQTDLARIHQTLAVNLGGMFNVIDRVRPVMIEQGQGQIVLTGSVAGYRGLPGGQPYSATKAAIINYAESLKIELEDKNIDVRLICPGFVKTDMTAKNGFEMPMMISVEEAATDIVKGLKRGDFEIHFPKQFTLIMKLLDILPRPLYFMLMRAYVKTR